MGHICILERIPMSSEHFFLYICMEIEIYVYKFRYGMNYL